MIVPGYQMHPSTVIDTPNVVYCAKCLNDAGGLNYLSHLPVHLSIIQYVTAPLSRSLACSVSISYKYVFLIIIIIIIIFIFRYKHKTKITK